MSKNSYNQGKEVVPFKNGKKKERDEKGRFVEGYSGGPGRPKGSRNFDTIFDETIRRIAKEDKIDINDPEVKATMEIMRKAMKGSLAHYAYLTDRRHGKAPQANINVNVDYDKTVKRIGDIIRAEEKKRGIDRVE